MKMSMKCMVCCVALLGGGVYAQNAEFYYTLAPWSIKPLSDSDSPTINIGWETVQPTTDLGWFFANNILNPGQSFTSVSSSFDGGWYTGLATQDQPGVVSQKMLTPSNGGINLFQVYNGQVGMMLSTWGVNRPNPNILSSSLQFVKKFNNFSGKPSPWSSNSSSLLCANAVIDMHSWYGNNVQAMFTLAFSQNNVEDNWFFYNAMILDTNTNNPVRDGVISDNPFDTGAPIVINYLQSNGGNNPLIKYSSPPSNYGAVLSAYSQQYNRPASNVPNDQHYAFCISYGQFQQVLFDVNASRPLVNFSQNPADWNVDVILVSPEIAGEGDLGMSVKAMNLYRVYN